MDTLKLEDINMGKTIPIVIKQDRANQLVEKTAVRFKSNGGGENVKILVNNNFDWSTPDLPKWVKNIEKDGNYITISCEDNKGKPERKGNIKLRFYDDKIEIIQEIAIIQDDGGIVELNKIECTKDPYKGFVRSYAKDIRVSSNQEWCTATVNAKDPHQIDIKCTKNPTRLTRTAKVTVETGNRETIITVNQELNPKGPNVKINKENPFELKNWNRKVGLSVGYVQRGWNLSTDRKEEISTWEQPEVIPGVQAGLKLNTFFAPKTFGLGIDYGFYYEYASVNKTTMNPVNREYTYNFKRHSIYIPIHLLYKFDFTDNLGLFVYGGAGIDFGIMENIKATYVDENDPFYKSPDKMIISSAINKFNISTEFGGGLQFFRMIVSTGSFMGTRIKSSITTDSSMGKPLASFLEEEQALF